MCLTSVTWISRMYALIWWCFSPNWYNGRTDTAEDTEDDLTSSLSFLTIYHVLWKTSLCRFWLFSHISCLRETPLGISPGFLNVQPVPFWAPMDSKATPVWECHYFKSHDEFPSQYHNQNLKDLSFWSRSVQIFGDSDHEASFICVIHPDLPLIQGAASWH